MIIKRETWGFSMWRDGNQFGAGVGLDPIAFLGLDLNSSQRRMWRKKGIVVIEP